MTRSAPGARCLIVSLAFAAGQVLAQEAAPGHDRSKMAEAPAAPASPATPALALPDYIAPVSAADRQAAFPNLGGMTMRDHMADDPVQFLVLLDRLELRDAAAASPVSWDAKAWVGTDLNRLLLRSEGDIWQGKAESASLEALWARPVSRWWTAVAGVRQDFARGDSRNWLALGAVGLAPYRVDVEATAYVGDAGRLAFRVQAHYDLLLTNRLIAQPRLELGDYQSGGPGAGRSSVEAGLRLRYELRREFAPYVGLAWVRTLGTGPVGSGTAGRADSGVQAVAGLRVWF